MLGFLPCAEISGLRFFPAALRSMAGSWSLQGQLAVAQAPGLRAGATAAGSQQRRMCRPAAPAALSPARMPWQFPKTGSGSWLLDRGDAPLLQRRLLLARGHHPPPRPRAAAEVQGEAGAAPPLEPTADDEADAIAALPAAAVAAVPPRLRGITRKVVMRQINRTLNRTLNRALKRTLVRNIARRATIALPLVGLFFLTRVLRRDAGSLAAAVSRLDAPLAALFALAVAAECVDALAQCVNIFGLGVSSGLIPGLPAMMGAPAAAAAAQAAAAAALPALPALPSLPALLALADKTSLTCATVACAAGLAAEAISAARQLASADAAAASGGTACDFDRGRAAGDGAGGSPPGKPSCTAANAQP